jgi:hypothetical protein
MSGRRHYLASALILLGAFIWGAALVLGPGPWDSEAAGVGAAGLLAVATLATVSILVESSRLGYRLAWGLVAAETMVAVLHPISTLWLMGVIALTGAGLALAEPSLGGWVRRQPQPAPIPAAALTLCLVLLAAGPVVALASPHRPVGILPLLTAGNWLVLLWYVRRRPGREWVPRTLIPLFALSGLLLPSPARWGWLILQMGAAAAAWRKGARLAVRPLLERGHPVPIPPELAPAEVLEAARIDRSGRRLDQPEGRNR